MYQWGSSDRLFLFFLSGLYQKDGLFRVGDLVGLQLVILMASLRNMGFVSHLFLQMKVVLVHSEAKQLV